MFRETKLDVVATRYFLSVPERWYRWGCAFEKALELVPMGGQYAVLGRTRPF